MTIRFILIKAAPALEYDVYNKFSKVSEILELQSFLMICLISDLSPYYRGKHEVSDG